MDMGNLDLSSLDDLLGGDFDAASETPETQAAEPEAAPPPVTTPAGEEPATEGQQAETQAAQPEAPALNPEGPGDLKVALQQARERERAYRDQLAQVQQQQAQAEQQAQDAAFRSQLELIAEEDPAQAAALAAQYQAEQHQALAAQYQAEMANQRAVMSLEMARMSLPDFDAVIASIQRPEVAPFVNWQAFDEAPNPAMAIYQYAKQYAQMADPAAMRESLKAEILAEIQARQTPKTPASPPGISAIPAAASASAERTGPTPDDVIAMGLAGLDLL